MSFNLSKHIKGFGNKSIIFGIENSDFLELLSSARDHWSRGDDKFGLFAHPSTHFLTSFLGALCAGKKPILLNPKLKKTEIKKIAKLFNMSCFSPLDSRKKCEKNLEINKENIFYILTSGSTGDQKAVGHNFLSIEFAVDSFQEFYQLDKVEWQYSLPFYHSAGLMGFFRSFLKGDTYHFESHKDANCISLVPTQIYRELEDPQLKLQNYDLILIGGGLIPKSLFDKVKNYNISLSYGLSETLGQISATRISDKEYSHGEVLPGREIEVIDDKVVIRGGACLKHYLINTKEVDPLNDGGFYTNDLAKIIGGKIFIKGRQDQLFKVSGELLSPYKIESIILDTCKLEDCVVLPLKDREKENIPVLIYDGVINNSNDFIDLISNSLSSLEIPKFLIPLDSVGPQSSGIKLSRHLLKEKLASMPKDQLSEFKL